MLFSASVQSSIISLFSSTSSDPLTLFRASVDKSLPSDSFLHFLHDQCSSPPPSSPGSLLHLPKISEQDDSPSNGYELDQTVLHIQSPTIQTTYIQCPPKAESRDKSNVLGVRHPWMHLQVRNLGREWAFEVGIVDHAGRVGIVRLSTFQVNPFSPPLIQTILFPFTEAWTCGHTSNRCVMKFISVCLLSKDFVQTDSNLHRESVLGEKTHKIRPKRFSLVFWCFTEMDIHVERTISVDSAYFCVNRPYRSEAFIGSMPQVPYISHIFCHPSNMFTET